MRNATVMGRAWRLVVGGVCIGWLALVAAGAWGGEAAVQEVEPNDGFGDAQKVPLPCTVRGKVREGGDTDHYTMTVEAATFLCVRVKAVAKVDFRLDLLGGEGDLLASRNGQGLGKGEDLVRRVRRGEHVLVVTATSEGAAANAPYTLELRTTDLLDYQPPTEEIKAAIKKGLKHLASKQKPDGRWDVQMAPHGISGLALMGFVGEKLPEFERNVQSAIGFFKKSYVAPGTYKDDPREEAYTAGALTARGGHFLYEQAIAVLALAEYVHEHKTDAQVAAMLTEGARLLVRSQHAAAKPKILGGPGRPEQEFFGSWRYRPDDDSGDLSASGWCVIALVAAQKAGVKLPESVRKDFLTYCRKCFNPETGFYGYQTGGEATYTTTAIGVLTSLLCAGGEDPHVRKGLATLRKNFPAWEEEGGPGLYPLYYWYYASRAMYMAGGDYWKQWQAVVCPMLLDNQNADGSWDAAQREKEVGTEYTTAVAILILQLCSGNPPAYLEGLTLERPRYECPRCIDDIEALLKAARKDDRTKEQSLKQIQELIDRYHGE